MMAWKLSNFARMSLIQSAALADTTIYVSATDGDLLPALGASDKAPAILHNATQREIVYITAEAGGTLTVERARESTTARDWPAGTILTHTPTATILQAVLTATTAVVFSGTATNVASLYTVNVGAGNPLPTYADGERASFLINAVNDGAVTVNFTDGTTTTTTKSIKHQDNNDLEAGDFAANWIADVRFNAAQDCWFLVSDTSFNEHAYQVNDGPLPAANRHSNGKLDFWNNGTSFSTPASGAETADGWIVDYDGSIGAFTVSRQAFTLGQTAVEGDPKYFIRWDQSAAGSGSTVRRLIVKLPGVHWRNGQQVAHGFWIKADTNRTVTEKLIQHFGTGGSPSADVTTYTQARSVTTSWQKFTKEPTLTSITGKVLGSAGDDALWLVYEFPVNVTMTIDIAMDDLRPGHIAGLQSDTFPVPWWLGGLGGSFASGTDFWTVTGQALWAAANPDLALIEAIAGTGLVFRNNTGPVWGTRSLAVGSGLLVANADATAGNPTISLDTALANYVADPLSVGELASITAAFGTAAFKNTGTSGSDVPLLDGTNSWSGAQTFTSTLTLNSATPFWSIRESDASATNQNWLIGANAEGFHISTAADGTPFTQAANAVTINRTATTVDDITFGAPLLAPAGAVGAPAISFSGDPNTGIYSSGVDEIAFATNGTLRWYIGSSGGLVSNGPSLHAANGAVGTPAYSFSGDQNSGLYSIGADNIGLALNGSLAVDFSTSRMLMASGIDILLNSATEQSNTHSVGFRGAPVVDGNAAYAFPRAAAGSTVYHDEAGTRTYTIPANASVAHPVGTMFIIDNTGNSGAAGAITLAITSDTLRRGDGTAGTGSRTIPASAVAVIRKVASTVWVITGKFT